MRWLVIFGAIIFLDSGKDILNSVQLYDNSKATDQNQLSN